MSVKTTAFDAPIDSEPLPQFELHSAPGHLIRRAHQLAVAQFVLHCEGAGLTSVQFGALTSIAQQPGIDQARLSMHLALDAVTVGSVLSRLESKKLIVRTADTKDKRCKSLCATALAQQVLRDITPQANAAQVHILKPLNHAEKIQFMQLLKQVIQGLEAA